MAGKVENSNSNPRKWLDEGHRPERVNTGKIKWIVQNGSANDRKIASKEIIAVLLSFRLRQFFPIL